MAAGSTSVIVGASLPGAKAAETLRIEGFDGRVVLIGAEPERPYERPALSKGFLQGTSERDRLFVHDERFYADMTSSCGLPRPSPPSTPAPRRS